MTSHSVVQGYIKTLAAIYERHWMHVERDEMTPNPYREGVCSYSSSSSVDSVIEEPRFGVLQAILEVGQLFGQLDPHLGNDIEVNVDDAFHCQLFQGWGNEDDEPDLILEDGDFLEPVWKYPLLAMPTFGTTTMWIWYTRSIDSYENDSDLLNTTRIGMPDGEA